MLGASSRGPHSSSAPLSGYLIGLSAPPPLRCCLMVATRTPKLHRLHIPLSPPLPPRPAPPRPGPCRHVPGPVTKQRHRRLVGQGGPRLPRNAFHSRHLLLPLPPPAPARNAQLGPVPPHDRHVRARRPRGGSQGGESARADAELPWRAPGEETARAAGGAVRMPAAGSRGVRRRPPPRSAHPWERVARGVLHCASKLAHACTPLQCCAAAHSLSQSLPSASVPLWKLSRVA